MIKPIYFEAERVYRMNRKEGFEKEGIQARKWLRSFYWSWTVFAPYSKPHIFDRVSYYRKGGISHPQHDSRIKE